jgi:hypothetical protein
MLKLRNLRGKGGSSNTVTKDYLVSASLWKNCVTRMEKPVVNAE